MKWSQRLFFHRREISKSRITKFVRSRPSIGRWRWLLWRSRPMVLPYNPLESSWDTSRRFRGFRTKQRRHSSESRFQRRARRLLLKPQCRMQNHSARTPTKFSWLAWPFNAPLSRPEVQHDFRSGSLQYWSSESLSRATLERPVHSGRAGPNGARLERRPLLVHSHPNLHRAGRQAGRTGEVLVSAAKVPRDGQMRINQPQNAG